MGFLPSGIGWQRKEEGNDGGKFPVRRGTSAIHSCRKLFAESFPTRRGSSAVHGGRKLFAESFPTRRDSSAVHGGRKLFAEVSYSPWQQCGSWLQETVCGKFPTQRGTSAVHSGRKRWAKSFLSGVAPWRSMTAGKGFRQKSPPMAGRGLVMIISLPG